MGIRVVSQHSQFDAHPINADGTIDLDERWAEHILYDTGGFDEDGFELYELADTADRTVIEEYLETTK